MIRVFRILIVILVLSLSGAAGAVPLQNGSFERWLWDVQQDAVASGVSADVAQSALNQVTLDERVVELDQKQPESNLSFAAYSEHVLNPERVRMGRILMRKHAVLLHKMYRRYGVPPHIVVALWGMESNFGHNSGDFSVLDALATLAYEGHRPDFFRSELVSALRVLDQEHVPLSELRGSWAGAMGQCQFMPSTYLRYAVDFDNKGMRDIWANTTDVLASIANYVAALGWRSDLTWGREVRLKKPVPAEKIGLDHQYSLIEWEKMGVRDIRGRALPGLALEASLIQPDGADGRSFLVYDNFRALTRWNRSTYFAASVGLLADKIKSMR